MPKWSDCIPGECYEFTRGLPGREIGDWLPRPFAVLRLKRGDDVYTRMNADAWWQTLVAALGPLGGGGMGGPKGKGGPFGGAFGLEGIFKNEFRFDPSTKPEEVEGWSDIAHN